MVSPPRVRLSRVQWGLSRVTGGQPSSIDGMLRSEIAGANLYLLNPSGVLFGPNASLNVSGSFHVSTADFLRLADGAQFHAHLGQESLLTVAPPAAFGFLASTPAPITVQESQLGVPIGRTLSMVGGDITIAGGILQAPSGRIQLASVASPGDVVFTPLELAPDLQMDNVARLGRIAISEGALVTVSSPVQVPMSRRPGAGTVLIRGGRLLVDNAFVTANTTGVGDGARLGIDVRLTEGLVLRNDSLFVADSRSAGRAGDLQLQAGSVYIEHASILSRASASGDSARITISTPMLTIDGSLIATATSSVDPSGGRAGDIVLDVGRLILTAGGTIASITGGTGQGGAVHITAADAIVISGHLRNGTRSSQLATTTEGRGEAGRILISTPTLTMDGGLITASTSGSGRAGDIVLDVGRLTLTDGAQIDSRTRGVGHGGTVTIVATESIVIAGSDREGVPSGLFSTTQGAGLGGNLQVVAPHIQLSNGGTIAAGSSGDGAAGSVVLQAGDTFQSEQGSVTTASASAGGGTIALRAGRLVRLRDSTLTTTVQGGGGDAGNLMLEAPLIVAEQSDVIANAFAGQGGNIRLVAVVFLADPASVVSASSALGLQGTVEIQAPVTELSGSVGPLPQVFVSAAELLPARCVARLAGGTTSSLVLGGRDGVPPAPGGLLPSPLTFDDRLTAGPAMSGSPPHQHAPARFTLLTSQDKALPRLGCP